MRDRLRRLWRGWVEITGYIGDFQARMLLTLFYFTVALPFGLVARLLDPLQARSRMAPDWMRRNDPDATLSAARRQF